jgi:hypothetical protein
MHYLKGRNMMRRIRIILVLLLAMLYVVTTVYAVSSPPPVTVATTSTGVAAFLQKNVVDFLTNVPAGRVHDVSFIATTNNQNGAVSCIIGSSLKYNKNTGTLTGDGVQYFSDRLYSNNPVIPGGINIPTIPFDPKRTESVSLTFNVNNGSIIYTKWNLPQKITVPDYNGYSNCIIGVCDQAGKSEITISFQKHEGNVYTPPH